MANTSNNSKWRFALIPKASRFVKAKEMSDRLDNQSHFITLKKVEIRGKFKSKFWKQDSFIRYINLFKSLAYNFDLKWFKKVNISDKWILLSKLGLKFTSNFNFLQCYKMRLVIKSVRHLFSLYKARCFWNQSKPSFAVVWSIRQMIVFKFS